MNRQQNLKIGIDGGGTKCRAVIFDDRGAEIGAGIAGPANVARIGIRALSAIEQSVVLALVDAGLTESSANPEAWLAKCEVSAGLAGATVAESVRLLENWQHPFASFRFTSDLHAALVGAHSGRNGAVLVMGTGSCSAALVREECVQFGGHGFVIGDKGSGAWYGLEAVRYTLEALDGVVAESVLSARICEHFGVADTTGLVDLLNDAPSSKFASAAGVVFSSAADQDEVALSIVETGAAYLSAIAERALQSGGGGIALVGGLAEVVQPFLSEKVRAAARPAEKGAEWGAVHATMA